MKNIIKKEQLKEYFIEILKNLKKDISSENPNWSYYYLPNNDITYIIHNSNTNVAYLDTDKVWSVFKSKLSLNYNEIKELTSDLISRHLKLKGVKTLNKNKSFTFRKSG